MYTNKSSHTCTVRQSTTEVVQNQFKTDFNISSSSTPKIIVWESLLFITNFQVMVRITF